MTTLKTQDLEYKHDHSFPKGIQVCVELPYIDPISLFKHTAGEKYIMKSVMVFILYLILLK